MEQPDALTSATANILLVDDQEANLRALESILTDLGQNLVMARSGSDALTGYDAEEDLRQSREAGFQYHLLKPAAPTELERVLKARAG